MDYLQVLNNLREKKYKLDITKKELDDEIREFKDTNGKIIYEGFFWKNSYAWGVVEETHYYYCKKVIINGNRYTSAICDTFTLIRNNNRPNLYAIKYNFKKDYNTSMDHFKIKITHQEYQEALDEFLQVICEFFAPDARKVLNEKYKCL